MGEQLAFDRWLSQLNLNGGLSSAERQALSELPLDELWTKRGSDLDVRASAGRVHIVETGLVGWYRQGLDGNRQVCALHWPGDVCDLVRPAQGDDAVGFVALINSRYVTLPRGVLNDLALRYPAFSHSLWQHSETRSRRLAEWTFMIGRLSGVQRIAHLLCEIGIRIEAGGGSRTDFDPLPNQDLIGEIVSLTSVHVNRMIRQLREQNLIATSKGRLVIKDWSALARFGDFAEPYLY